MRIMITGMTYKKKKKKKKKTQVRMCEHYDQKSHIFQRTVSTTVNVLSSALKTRYLKKKFFFLIKQRCSLSVSVRKKKKKKLAILCAVQNQQFDAKNKTISVKILNRLTLTTW